MKRTFVVLMACLGTVASTGSLTGCVVAPAQPAYGYDYGYAPGYYESYPAYAEPSVGIGIGFGGGGWHDRDDWHGRGGGHGRGGWHDRH